MDVTVAHALLTLLAVVGIFFAVALGVVLLVLTPLYEPLPRAERRSVSGVGRLRPPRG